MFRNHSCSYVSLSFSFSFLLDKCSVLGLTSLLCMHAIRHARYTHTHTESILMCHHTLDDNNALYRIRQQKIPINGSYFCPRTQLRPNPPSIIKPATGNRNHHNGNTKYSMLPFPVFVYHFGSYSIKLIRYRARGTGMSSENTHKDQDHTLSMGAQSFPYLSR